MYKRKFRKVIKIGNTVREEGKSEVSESRVLSTHRDRESFLVEIEHNHDIKPKTREEIEIKFKKSQVNATYVFPRIVDAESVALPQLRLEARHTSHNETAYRSRDHSMMIKSIVNTSLNQENSLSEKYRISSIANKNIKSIRHNGFHSITPIPYLPEAITSNLDRLKQFCRNTPTPGSHLKHSLISHNHKIML